MRSIWLCVHKDYMQHVLGYGAITVPTAIAVSRGFEWSPLAVGVNIKIGHEPQNQAEPVD